LLPFSDMSLRHIRKREQDENMILLRHIRKREQDENMILIRLVHVCIINMPLFLRTNFSGFHRYHALKA
jgi:hypothetical protein